MRLAAPLLQMPSPSPSPQLALLSCPLRSLLHLRPLPCLLWQPSPRITAPRAAPTATAAVAASAILQATVAQTAPRHYYSSPPAAGVRVLHSRTIRRSPRHPSLCEERKACLGPSGPHVLLEWCLHGVREMLLR